MFFYLGLGKNSVTTPSLRKPSMGNMGMRFPYVIDVLITTLFLLALPDRPHVCQKFLPQVFNTFEK